MTTANPCCPEALPALRAPTLNLLEDIREALGKTLRAWRERQGLRATRQVLDELSDATRRDLGLAERQLHSPGAGSPARLQLPWG